MFNNCFQNSRVLITGHTGFKGSWLSEWLLHLGAKVSGYSLYIPSSPSHFEVLNQKDRLNHFEGDIRDLEALNKVFTAVKPDYVFHLAAQPIVKTAYEDPAATFSTNLIGTINVLECLRKNQGIKAGIIVTSDKCYENVEWLYGYREIDRLGGKDPYSASKACAEIAFSSYARSYFNSPESPAIASARAGNVIGGGDWADHRIVPDCVRAIASHRKPDIRNPKATRPWQHVLEPLGGYLWLASQLPKNKMRINHESFNFGPPSHTTQTVEELIHEMKKYWPDPNWNFESSQLKHEPEAGLLRLNCDKALQDLQWFPTLDFPETIELTSVWYRNFYQNPNSARESTIQQIEAYQKLAKKRGVSWATE